MAGSRARLYLQILGIILILVGVFFIFLLLTQLSSDIFTGAMMGLLGVALIYIGIELILISGRMRAY